jgi:hypothetical protein
MIKGSKMYQVLHRFLANPTWYTRHPVDEKRFFQALHLIVRDDAFNADAMGKYMFQETGLSPDSDDTRARAIESYVGDAWAVRQYLEATGAI